MEAETSSKNSALPHSNNIFLTLTKNISCTLLRTHTIAISSSATGTKTGLIILALCCQPDGTIVSDRTALSFYYFVL